MIAVKSCNEVWVDHPEWVTRFGNPVKIRIGVKITLEDGVSAFYSPRFGTISVTYPGLAETYNSGTPVRDLANRVVMGPDRKNKAISLKEFAKCEKYSLAFVMEVMTEISKWRASL